MGKGWRRSRIIRAQESLVLYKSVNTLRSSLLEGKVFFSDIKNMILFTYSSSLLSAFITYSRDCIFKHLRSPGIDFKESIPPAYVACAGILQQYVGARNRVGIGLSYRPARLHRLAESNPWNSLNYLYENHIPTRFLASIDCSKIPAQVRLTINMSASIV